MHTELQVHDNHYVDSWKKFWDQYSNFNWKITAMALQKFYQIENVSSQRTNNVPKQTNI
jgi:hypothetical protein